MEKLNFDDGEKSKESGLLQPATSFDQLRENFSAALNNEPLSVSEAVPVEDPVISETRGILEKVLRMMRQGCSEDEYFDLPLRGASPSPDASSQAISAIMKILEVKKDQRAKLSSTVEWLGTFFETGFKGIYFGYDHRYNDPKKAPIYLLMEPQKSAVKKEVTGLSRYRVLIEMEATDRNGNELDGTNLWEEIEVRAASEDDAREEACRIFDSRPGERRRPNGYTEVDKI